MLDEGRSASADLLPAGFTVASRVNRPSGSLDFAVREEPACLWVCARGYVGPRLLAADLAFAEHFGRAHLQGWSYVADTTRVVAVNPLNVLWLRRIPELPNLRRYIVIAPIWSRFFIRLAGGFVGLDAVVTTEGEALDAAGITHG